MTDRERITNALDIVRDGVADGDHHKMWIIDQIVRALTGCPVVDRTGRDYKGEEFTYQALGASPEYLQFVSDYQDGEDGPDTYTWDEGIAP